LENAELEECQQPPITDVSNYEIRLQHNAVNAPAIIEFSW